MSTTGRKPVPGGDVERAAERAGASGDIVTMEPPDDLTEDARALWAVILPDLIRLKVFAISDAPMLAELCSSLAYARAFRAEMDSLTLELAKAGSLLATLPRRDLDEEQRLQLHEALAEYDFLSGALKRARSGYTQMMRVAMNLASDFAISPVSRLRLGLMKTRGATLLGILGKKDGADVDL